LSQYRKGEKKLSNW